MTSELETKVGGGYEAAARECERLAGESGKRNTAHGDGERRAYIQAARIIREHAQHVPVVDREGLEGLEGLAREMESLGEPWRWERLFGRAYADGAVNSYKACAALVRAHLGAQAATPATCANCRGTDITPPRCETCGARGDELTQPAAVPGERVVSEPGAAVRLTAITLTPEQRAGLTTGGARIPGRNESPRPFAATGGRTEGALTLRDERSTAAAVPASEPVLQLTGAPTITSPVTGLEVVVPPGETRTHEARDGSVYTFTRASEPAPASEPAAVTDAMVEAAIDAWHERSPALLDKQMRHVLHAALAAAPQRVREVGEAEAREVEIRHRSMLGMDGEVSDSYAHDLALCMRAAGLCVAVPDTEWAALERTRDAYLERINELTGQLAAATKRAEEAERERDTWRETSDLNAIAANGTADKLLAAEARVRELEKRAEEAEARARDHLGSLRNYANTDVRGDLEELSQRVFAFASDIVAGVSVLDAARCLRAYLLGEGDASHARVRELAVVVRDEGARKALEAVIEAARLLAMGAAYNGPHAEEALGVARAALNGEG